MPTPGRTFIDTNVLVYAVDEDEPRRRDRAREVLAVDPASHVLSTQVLSEFYVVATRKLERPMSHDDAAEAVRALARLTVIGTDGALVLEGIRISHDHQVSYWDAMIVAAARLGGCERVLTEDLDAGGEIEGVRIENPFA